LAPKWLLLVMGIGAPWESACRRFNSVPGHQPDPPRIFHFAACQLRASVPGNPLPAPYLPLSAESFGAAAAVIASGLSGQAGLSPPRL